MLFQWKRLASNQFRLLERRTPLPNGEQSFVLKTFAINSTSLPAYVAITYPKPPSESSTSSVVLNDRSFSLPKSASEALLQVQRHDAEGCEYLWIDWLCVNQKDENERKIQEEIMQRIFEGSKCIVAYLSDNTLSSKTIRRLSEQRSPTTSFSSSEREELCVFANSFGDLSQLPGGQRLWSSSGIHTKADVVLHAGDDHLERRELEIALGLVRGERPKSPASSSL